MTHAGRATSQESLRKRSLAPVLSRGDASIFGVFAGFVTYIIFSATLPSYERRSIF